MLGAFEIRAVAIEPGHGRAYDEDEWADALVFVQSGEVELESLGGAAWRFLGGDVLWLVGLPLRALHNRGDEPAVLLAVSRRSSARLD